MDKAAAPFQVTICPWCLYSLGGLPETGDCPECGHAYEAESLLIPSPAITVGQQRGWELPFLIYGAWMVKLSAEHGPGWFWLGGGGVVVAMVAFTAWRIRYYYLRRHGLMLYLCATGFSQTPRELGVRTLHPWLNDLDININQIGKRWQISIVRYLVQNARMTFDADAAGIELIRQRLSAWQSSRVWVNTASIRHKAAADIVSR